MRHVVLRAAGDLEGAALQRFIAMAIAPAQAKLAHAPRLATLVKSVSARQRPRRPPAAKARRRARAARR